MDLYSDRAGIFSFQSSLLSTFGFVFFFFRVHMSRVKVDLTKQKSGKIKDTMTGDHKLRFPSDSCLVLLEKAKNFVC